MRPSNLIGLDWNANYLHVLRQRQVSTGNGHRRRRFFCKIFRIRRPRACPQNKILIFGVGPEFGRGEERILGSIFMPPGSETTQLGPVTFVPYIR